jgi:hypothetical protein
MGTSSSSRGPASGTPLVPTWLDEPATGPLPGAAPDAAPDDADGGDGGNPQPPADRDDAARPAIPAPPAPGRYQGGRYNFSTFASSGGNDGRALRRAARDYVRSGAGGTGNAVRKMGSSRAAASGALGVFRGFQRDGVADTLARLNLQNLVGRSTRDIFIGLTDVICKDGGLVDEAIARDAWLETVAEIESFGIEDLNALTTDQVREVFLTFITHAVETKLFQEIGVNGFKVADFDRIQAFESQLRSYIERSVRDSFASDLSALSSFSDQQIRDVVDRTFRDAWELLVAVGDQEG